MTVEKTIGKVTTPTNPNRSKERDEPIKIPSNYLSLTQSAGKSAPSRCDPFWFCFSLVENWRKILKPIRSKLICFGPQGEA